MKPNFKFLSELLVGGPSHRDGCRRHKKPLPRLSHHVVRAAWEKLLVATRPNPVGWATRSVMSLLVLSTLICFPGCNEKKPEAKPKTLDDDYIVKTVEKDGVTLTVRVSPKHPRLSDTIALELTVRAEPDVEIKRPEFGKGVTEFTIRDYDVLSEKMEEGKIVRRYRYKLEAEQAGKLLIRSQQIEYISKRTQEKEPGKRTFILSSPIELFLTTETGNKPPDLSDVGGTTEPMAIEPKPLPAWVIALIAAVVLGGAGAALYFAKRKRVEAIAAEIVKTPEEIARAELDALLAEKLAEREEFKEFYVRLTGIVRRYIERKTGINAPEQTTEEFLHDPATRRTFSLDKAQRLGQFLEAADMVKYAAMRPGPRELAESVDRAKEFIGMPSDTAAAPV